MWGWGGGDVWVEVKVEVWGCEMGRERVKTSDDDLFPHFWCTALPLPLPLSLPLPCLVCGIPILQMLVYFAFCSASTPSPTHYPLPTTGY